MHMLLALLLVTLPLLSPLRGDVAYMLRKAWPGSVLERATAAVSGRPAGQYSRISVTDVSALVAIAMAIATAVPSAIAAPYIDIRDIRQPPVLLSAIAVPVVLLVAFDLRYRVLPNMLTLPLAGVGLLAAALGVGHPAFLNNFLPSLDVFQFYPPDPGPVRLYFSGDPARLDLTSSAIGCFGAGAALWLVQNGFRWLRGVDGLGGGDVKLAAAMGAWLGPTGCALAIAVAALSALAAEVTIGLVRHGRIDPKRRIPFGAYLCGAFWIALCAGIAA